MKYIISGILLAVSVMYAAAQDTEYNLENEYSISRTGTLHMSTDDAEITIEGTDRSDVSVKIRRSIESVGIKWGGEDFEVIVEERNGDLYIRERNESNVTVSIGYYKEEYTITLIVPESINLDLDGDDDDYNIRTVAGDIYIDADDSDIRLSRCTGNRFKFKIDDGDLEMDQGTGSIDVDIDDGDVDIRNASFSSITARSDDGELNIETSLDDDGEYLIRSDDGRINLIITHGGGEFDISHDDGSVRASDAFEFLEKEEHRSIIRLPHGKARIRISSDDARVSLNNM